MQYEVEIDGQMQGPYSEQELRNLFLRGLVTAETPCRSQGWLSKYPLSRILPNAVLPPEVPKKRRDKGSARKSKAAGSRQGNEGATYPVLKLGVYFFYGIAALLAFGALCLFGTIFFIGALPPEFQQLGAGLIIMYVGAMMLSAVSHVAIAEILRLLLRTAHNTERTAELLEKVAARLG